MESKKQHAYNLFPQPRLKEMDAKCHVSWIFINSRIKGLITSLACTVSSNNKVPSKAMIASTPKLNPVHVHNQNQSDQRENCKHTSKRIPHSDVNICLVFLRIYYFTLPKGSLARVLISVY